MLGIRGSFAVTKVRLTHTNINYLMLFTNDRVIFVKVARRNLRLVAGETGLALLLGSAAEGLTGAHATPAPSMAPLPAGEAAERTNALSSISADDLIGTDKDNFGLLYRHISRIRMKKSTIGHIGARSGVIDLNILGKKRATFDIVKGQDYEQCRSVVAAVMSDKLQ